MKTATITLIKPLSSNIFRIRILSLFKKIIFGSNYINAHIELILHNNDVINLDEYMVINIKDKETIKTFAIKNEVKFISLFKKTKNVNVKKIIFYYVETNENSYKNFIDNFNKSFNNIGKPFNIYKNLVNNSLGKRFYSTSNNNLNTKNIILKQNLNEFNLRQYLFKFFNETNFSSNYIFVLVKINYQEVFEFKTMYYKTIINLYNNQDKINYINNVIKYFNDHDNGYNPLSGDKIIINWYESNKIIYDRIQRNKKDIIKLYDIPNYFNVPWNINYKSWCNLNTNVIEIDNKNYRLNNFIYSDKISFVNICLIDSSKFRIELHLKDYTEVFSFIDTDLTKEGNGYRRYFEHSNGFFLFILLL